MYEYYRDKKKNKNIKYIYIYIYSRTQCMNITGNIERAFYKHLTNISLASHFCDIDKQCRPRSDAAECGV